ncbi:MAG: alpha/beta hydrolase [Polaromonas sp.]|uniref:alpha/beta hydrolase n=1 Tax=Polaromonas sp. TaxID=1869339 RepID=UPI002734FA4D|nr:alpha/beta fold hydrolase [Polaromonas sp.]MDP2816677.1 alpha/beta hydrolase [Polaromonas sp.]
MVRLAATLLTVLALGYLALCLALFVFQRSLIYYPQPRSTGSAATTLNFKVADADLAVTVRPVAGPQAILYFGGNAEDVSLNLPSFSEAFPAHAMYLLHYRGYGGSTGRPSEQALQADALALFDHVRQKHPKVVLIGRSLGSGVAIQVASQRPVHRLVLVTPYNSLQELAEKQFPYFPVKCLLTDKFESWKYAPLVTAPTLLIAAEHDEVIPRWSTEQLYARFKNSSATLEVLPGTSHNTLSASPSYLGLLQSVL